MIISWVLLCLFAKSFEKWKKTAERLCEEAEILAYQAQPRSLSGFIDSFLRCSSEDQEHGLPYTLS